MIQETAYTHRASVPVDDGEPVTFKWHFARGILKPNMTAFELAAFILPQMPFILPFFKEQPRVYVEFEAMMVLLATSPRAAIDKLVPWIRTVYHAEEDDIIFLSLFDKTEQRVPRTFLIS